MSIANSTIGLYFAILMGKTRKFTVMLRNLNNF